jgi:energy-coupling factor transporter transmembrane protein EcfT
MARTTPYSQLANILLFVPSVLIIDHFILLGLQTAVFLCAFFQFKLRYQHIRPAQMLHLLPIILFICLLNAMKGGGEALLRVGPFLVTRQGLMRGAYLAVFILELYFMSRILTDAYEQRILLQALSTIDGKLHRGKKHGELMVLLYYIVRIFKNSYGELRVLFRRGQSVRLRVL